VCQARDPPILASGEAKSRSAPRAAVRRRDRRRRLRSGFARAAEAKQTPVELTTFGGGGLLPGVDLDDSAGLLDLMERSD
jgi:hypothetical protein